MEQIKILDKTDLGSVVYVNAVINDEEKKVVLIYDNEKTDTVAFKLEELLKNRLEIEFFYCIPNYKFYFTTSWRPHVKGMTINDSPVIRENEECIIEKLEEKGVEYHIDGRSGFSSRNTVVIDDPAYEPKKRLITNWGWESDYTLEDQLGPLVEKEGRDKYPQYVLLLKEEKIEITDYSDLQTLIKDIREECEEEYERTVAGTYGNIINGVEFGPYEKFDKLPNNYIEIFSIRTKCTADYRQNHTHTYRVWAVRKGTKGVVVLNNIPDEEKGKIIGKGGVKIKEACRLIGCKKIVLK